MSAMTGESRRRDQLRLWPGVLLVAVQWIVWYGGPTLVDGAPGVYASFFGALLGGIAVLVWWVFFSRAARVERWGGALLMIVAVALTRPLLHPSIATWAMGVMFVVYAFALLSLALVVWAVVTRRLDDGLRRAILVATIVVVCGAWTLLKGHGNWGGGGSEFSWRWSATPEQRLLAQEGDVPSVLAAQPISAEAPIAWSGFRGSGRDGVVRGVRIATDWAAAPPVELWRRPIGPGWSSFAVSGDLVFTQEQRGEFEVVSAYRLSSGEPVWRHQDEARFWEAMGGAGPRATPSLADGRAYTFGATGIVNALDAGTGAVVWSRNALADVDGALPGWGFASSPLLVDDLVVVAVAGQLVAYERATGEPRWVGKRRGTSYSSPHLATIDGVTQILLLTGGGVTAVAPQDGTPLWEHRWPGFHCLQPALTDDGDVLIAVANDAAGVGTRRLALSQGADGWQVEERWTTRRLKPYFNDLVVHEGHAYGFDGGILAAIDLSDGERRWKGGRFGHGQIVLLADQDLLLVLSETGELGLVEARPEAFTELARVPAIEGKTWNHPVLVGDVLLVRNDEEMAAFRLAQELR